MDDEPSNQELVKCVLVGDNAVGKTRLICARARRNRVSLSQLLNTHVPTVWAIDQYRIYKEVLDNSMMVLDGVNVSLRLWDTFGDHHKDRRFAYGRSDVVLMCFDVGKLSSLENCVDMWYNEVKKFCPNTPVLLIGCKNDVRFMYKDPQYIKYCQERSPLVRQVRENDLVMPDQGRAVAKELGLPYFETSVLTYFGVNEVFENAVRAALCVRRQQRFWMTNLRRVQRPRLQEPFRPPKPTLPEPEVKVSQLHYDMEKLLRFQHFSDLIFSCGNVGFSAHRFILATASPLLNKIFLSDFSQELNPTRSSSETSLLSASLSSFGAEYLCNDESENLISAPNEPKQFSLRSKLRPNLTPKAPSMSNKINDRSNKKHRRSTSFHVSPSLVRSWRIADRFQELQQSQMGSSDIPKNGLVWSINHPALHHLKLQQCESLDDNGQVITSLQTILTCTKLITPMAMRQLIQFVYTGEVNPSMCSLTDLKQAAEYLNVPDLYHHVSKLMLLKENISKAELVPAVLCDIEEICLVQGQFADIIVKLDDGALVAHKPLLMARCDMMLAMFTHEDFVESSARVIKFPGVNCFTFQEFLYYLYTDQTPRVNPRNCMGILELANRLCLPRLITLVEESVIKTMNLVIEAGGEVTEEAIDLLQPSQIHNAEQLSEWCLCYLAQNYNHICRKFPKTLRSLHPENQAWLNVHRWPPIWYLKDHDFFQRMMVDREHQEGPKKALKRSRKNSVSGCLCFPSNKSKRE